MEPYFGLVALILMAGGTVGGMVALHLWLGPRLSGKVHDAPFECGKEPFEIVRGRFPVKFFLVALLFILFDIELIFLIPWAIVYRSLPGWFGFVEMLIFLMVVLAGLYYSVKKGVLEWS